MPIYSETIAYSRASQTTQTMVDPTPCRVRARHISQYAGASMNMICEPMRINTPATRGNFRASHFSDHTATGIVAVTKLNDGGDFCNRTYLSQGLRNITG